MKNSKKGMLKQFVFIVTFCLGAVLSTAQAQGTTMEEVEIFQALYGMQKREVVANFTQLEEEHPFWKIYNEYEAERKELGKERLLLFKEYVNNYKDLTDKRTDDLLKEGMKLGDKLDKMKKSYYKKVKKICGSKIAAQFFQLEGYFLNSERLKAFENMLLRELEQE